jgi:hypothetical protein
MMHSPFIQPPRQDHELSGPSQNALTRDGASVTRTSYATHGENISKERT